MADSPACKHQHTRLIAKDNEAEYIECTDCGAILETHELTDAPKSGDAKPNKPQSDTSNSIDESLSDA